MMLDSLRHLRRAARRLALAAALLGLVAHPLAAQTATGVNTPSTDGTPLPTTAGAPDDPMHRFRWFGEELFYSIQILNSAAARSALAIGYPTETADYGVVIPIQGIATSVGMFGTVYPLRDTSLTWVKPETGTPRWSEKTLDERGLWRRYTVDYYGDSHHADVLRERRPGSARYRREMPSDIHDAFSWILDLRSRPLERGNVYTYYIYDGWKLSRLTARIGGTRDIHTGIGFIECAEISFTREVLDSYQPLPWLDDTVDLPPVFVVTERKRLGKGWFSIDERRLPVGVEIDTPIGHMRVLLERHVPPNPNYVGNRKNPIP